MKTQKNNSRKPSFSKSSSNSKPQFVKGSSSRPTSHSTSRSASHSASVSGASSQSRSSHVRVSSGASSHKWSSQINKAWRIVAGTHAINEVVKIRPKSVKLAYIQKNLTNSQEIKELIEKLKEHKITVEERADIELEKFCSGHQGAVVFSDYNPGFDYTVAGWETQSMILALDGVEDPHNLGAIMRTSWLMGVSGIIIPQDRAVGLTSTVHKVACGGAEHVSIARINNFTEPFNMLKESGFWIYGLSHKAKKTIYDIKYPEKVVWVLGAEDKGLRIPTERACDELVCIPQLSADASYNVSVATAIALSETKRQWAK